MKYTLPALLDNSFANYSQNISLGFVGEESFTYSELKKEIDSLIVILEKFGIEKGNKVAILSTNMPNWGISFFALNYMGVIAVPILPDFHTKEIENIIIHAECKALFVSSNLIHKLKDIKADKLKTRILIDNFNEIEIGEDVNEVAIRFKNADYNSSPKMDHTVEENDLASIIYTSGTTGSSKGVMLTHKNIAYDAYHCESVYKVEPTDVMLSILPLSHSYENTIGLVLPIICGASVKYNKNPPTPTVLMAALKEVRPTVMLTVPLIIEKIYKGKVLPNINSKAITRTLYKFAPTRKLLNRVAGKKLYETFGGRLLFFGLGGAKVSAQVEQFLMEAKFPYAIGYGLTETAPMLCGTSPFKGEFQSTGIPMTGIEIKINDPDPETGEGEVWAKGPNVMLGYYKEPELTKKVITEDGWFKTGDLGIVSKAGDLHIRGRIKNMIVGSSGENIYPEEIESVINTYPYVLESLVLERKGKLVAMVHLNMEELEKKFHELKMKQHEIEARLDEILKEIQLQVNGTVNKFSQLQIVLHQSSPFERTPTQKVKRFLYS
ncbi:MAG: AMP-binding protein [Bacteroidetes bacterium]|jgi:long-chain acyl-CoA synthetase|nr:AMP-binding protein [Bacteroidota bacterium]MBT3423935.1 AMP-binding protein [Bacteroidota bacterium]MBT3934940.1 AMP-binding protein [Bacteroidota bacterium]MBT4339472.1 AMP-binding protein [Bacteroidota bacterium]MBT4969432.1 AMP-binding protein [Bacteroidota bacterium]